MPDTNNNHPCYLENRQNWRDYISKKITYEKFKERQREIQDKYFPNNGVSEDDREQLNKAQSMFGGHII
jgi:hypothetical protein